MGTFYSFSYGIEKLRAAILSAPDLADTEVMLLDLRSDDPEHFMAALEEFQPTLVGLSTYIWSLSLFDRLTERLRARFPDIPIVAGGPAARRSVFDLPTYHGLRDRLDAVVPGEGEEVIRAIVRHHHAPDWKRRVGGLEIPTRGLWRTTDTVERPVIDDYPSPYQLGLGPLAKTGYIETFRGCPIHCAFCQWGEQKSDRVHSADYLQRHLEGLRDADVPNVFFLDAAFNLSPRAFRALVAAEKESQVLRDKTVHGHLYPTYLEAHHLAFFDTLNQVQASVGIQSFDADVLKRLGRPFDLKKFEKVLDRMRGHLDFDVELILGLPGDNPDSFKRTVEKSFELGDTVKAFKCIVLPDALLERVDALSIDYDPDTFVIRSCDGWSAKDLDETWAWLYAMAEQSERPILNDDWVGFAQKAHHSPDKSGSASRGVGRNEASKGEISMGRSLPGEAVAALRVRLSTTGFSLESARRTGDSDSAGVAFALDGPGGRVELLAANVRDGSRYFLTREQVGYTHHGPVDRHSAPALRRVIGIVHGTVVDQLQGKPEGLAGASG